MAGLAIHALTLPPAVTVAAFVTMAAVFLVLLATAALIAGLVEPSKLGPLRMVGPAVKRWTGYVLMAVGLWFLWTALVGTPIIR